MNTIKIPLRKLITEGAINREFKQNLKVLPVVSALGTGGVGAMFGSALPAIQNIVSNAAGLDDRMLSGEDYDNAVIKDSLITGGIGALLGAGTGKALALGVKDGRLADKRSDRDSRRNKRNFDNSRKESEERFNEFGRKNREDFDNFSKKVDEEFNKPNTRNGNFDKHINDEVSKSNSLNRRLRNFGKN